MARSGPAVVSVEVKAVWTANDSNYAELPDIYEVTGGMVTAEAVATTALGDAVRSMGPTGVRKVDDIVLKGPFDPAANTAWTRIGAPDTSPGATTKGIRITFATGVSREFEVLLSRRDPIPSVDDQTLFEAVYYQAGTGIQEDWTA